MGQSMTLQKLNKRIDRIENEIAALRQELAMLPGDQSQISLSKGKSLRLFADKSMVREQMRQFLNDLSIEGDPIGIDALQEQMRETSLDNNELSQSIITAREE